MKSINAIRTKWIASWNQEEVLLFSGETLVDAFKMNTLIEAFNNISGDYRYASRYFCYPSIGVVWSYSVNASEKYFLSIELLKKVVISSLLLGSGYRQDGQSFEYNS